jgi:hypothetical protein
MLLVDHVNWVVQPIWFSISLMKKPIFSAASSSCKAQDLKLQSPHSVVLLSARREWPRSRTAQPPSR